MQLFKAHLLAKHKTSFYDYQLEVAYTVFDALLKNLRMTAGATEAEIKTLKITQLPIEFSRQSGKTTAIVHIIEYILIFLSEHFERPIAVGIFAPQREQAKTDFDRLKQALARTVDLTIIDHSQEDREKARQESNAKTIVLPNGSSCYIFPVTSTSKPESKTLDIIFFEEAQDLDDRIVKEQIWPMGAATNSPLIYIGTAGTRIGHFYRLVQAGDALVMPWGLVAADRRKVFEATGDARHLIYEQRVNEERILHGEQSDEFRRPYKLEWLIGTGQFMTAEQLDAMTTDRKRTFHDKESECFAGIDSAKNPDSTVVTVIRYNKGLKKKQLINWLELRGDNYKDQFDIIFEFLKKYKLLGLAIDSTGQGDFMPDMFERETEFQDENSGLYRVKFSAASKDVMYKNLKASVTELLTDLPDLHTREGERFRQQMLDLQQEWKGQFLSVNHPDAPNAHDDYPDSFALAEYAYARYNESRISAHVIDTKPKQDELDAREAQKVVDSWPGRDF